MRKIALPALSHTDIIILALAERRSRNGLLQSIWAISHLALLLFPVQSVHSDDEPTAAVVASFGALHRPHSFGNPDGKWFTYVSDEHVLGELTVDADVAFQLRTARSYLRSRRDFGVTHQ